MKVAGFTFIRNAVKNDYPIVAAITSILPICVAIKRIKKRCKFLVNFITITFGLKNMLPETADFDYQNANRLLRFAETHPAVMQKNELP